MSCQSVNSAKKNKEETKKTKRGRKSKAKNDSNICKKSKGDKKLVALSKKVLSSLKVTKESTGTKIAYEIMDMLAKEDGKKLDFKNVQRRVYDALNVFSALNIVHKLKNRVSLSDEGLKYLSEELEGTPKMRTPLPLPPMPAQKSERSKKLREEILNKMSKAKEAILRKRELVREKAMQLILLKKLVVRNCAKQFSIDPEADKVQLPFILCSIERGTDYDVMVSEDRKSALLSTDLVPSFYNDSHIIGNLNLFQSGLEEDEIKELLNPKVYEKIKTAFNKEEISKALMSQKITENLLEIPSKRKSRKRTREQLNLQCDEKFIMHPSSTDLSTREPKSRLSRKERKALEKASQNSNSQNQNEDYTVLQISKSEFEEFDKENDSQLDSSIAGDFVKHNFFDAGPCAKRQRSSVNMDSIDERIYLNTTPPAKFLPSPFKARENEVSPVPSRELKMEGTLFSPLNEKFRNLLNTGLEAVEWRNQKYNKYINTPLSKEVEMQMDKRTPCKDFSNLHDHYSPVKADTYISPKKDNYYEKGNSASPFIMKSPFLKKFAAIRDQGGDVFEDAITKAEHSNLFSSKSNQIQ